MYKHPALRPVDLGIALATCAAFSAAILGDIAANNLEVIIAADYPRPLYVLLILNTLLCAIGYLLGWRYFLYVWPLALFLFFRFGSTSNQIIVSFLLPVAYETPEWAHLLWIAPMLAGAALLLILLLWIFLLRHGMREPRKAAWVMLFFAMGAAYPSVDETAILLKEAYQPEAHASLAASPDIQRLQTARPVRPLPDIIALVPDRYPSNRVLRETFEYSNDAFSGALAERGFVVLDDVRANYQMTLMSLVSSLNLQILDTQHGDAIPLTSLNASLRRNLLAQILVQNGYEYVHLAGWSGATLRAPLADRIYNATHFIESHLTELEVKLLMLSPVFGVHVTFRKWSMDSDGHATYECQRLKRQLQHLRTLKRGEKPLFIWAHIYIPHNPLTMDAAGNCLPNPITVPQFTSVEAMSDKAEVEKFMSATAAYRKMFVDYMEAFNREALAIFDAQKQHSLNHGRELVFAILSDEGPYPILWSAITDKKILYERSAPHVLREKFGIFAALYADRIERADICALKSRVNVWRTVLGSILNVDLPPVDDVAQMPSEEMETREGMRYLGKVLSVRDRLGPQVPGGKGCQGVPNPVLSEPESPN